MYSKSVWMRKLAALFFASLMTVSFTACGGGGGSSGGGDDDGDSGDTNVYVGDRTLSGSVSLSGLSSEDQALLNTASTASAPQLTATGDPVVKLYVLDADGALKDTGITCSVDVTGSYSCANIAGGETYIVRYVRDLGDGNILDMRSMATVPTDANPAPVVVDPVSTLIAEAIMDAVEEAITGVVSDEALVQTIMASVQTAIKNTVTTLIQSGTIQIPSLVTEGTLEDVIGSSASAEGLSDTSGAILSDDNVTQTLDATKNSIQSTFLATMTNEEKIRMVFNQMMSDDDGGGAPDWMIHFLADRYSDVNASHTVGWATEMFLGNREYFRDTKELESMNLDDTFENIAVEINTTINNTIYDLTNGAVAEAKTAILRYHDLKTNGATTDEEVRFLAEFPFIVGELFPVEFISAMTTDTQFVNIAQATVYVIFLSDIYGQEIGKEVFTPHIVGDYFYEQLEHARIVDFDPFPLFMDLGLTSEVMDSYGKIYVADWKRISTGSYWDQDSGTESPALEFYTYITDSRMMSDANYKETISATLTYPTATGTATVDLNISDEWGDESLALYVSPYTCNESGCSQDVSRVISNHVSGAYTVTVTKGDETVVKTFSNVYIVANATSYRPKLVSPRPYPQWPGENATQEELDAFQAAEMEFWMEGVSVFAPNTDNNTLVGALFKWEAPDLSALSIPDYLKPAYQVQINRYQLTDMDQNGSIGEEDRILCDQNWEECNTEIFNTWWSNRPITGTTFTLPVALPVNQALNDEYNINVQLVLIDRETGEVAASGGNNYANFKVGTPDALSDASDINFSGTVGTIPAGVDSTKVKVALIAETNVYDPTTGLWTWSAVTINSSAVSGGAYEVNTTVGEVKTRLANRENFNLIIFVDEDGDGLWDPWTESSGGEMADWMQNRWFWFEFWGELRISSDGADGFVSKKVVDPGVTMGGMNFATPFSWMTN